MTKHLIIINGRSRAGKDTFANSVIDSLDLVQWGGYNLSSVKPFKDLLENQGIVDNGKGEDWRNLIVELKAAYNRYRRSADKMALNMVREVMSAGSNFVVFLHVRETTSIEFIKENAPFNWKVSTLWIERPQTSAQANDESYIPEIYDFLYTNSGSEDEWKTQAVEFAKKFSEV